MTVEVRILGSIEAMRDGARADVRGDRQRTLLAMLALTPGQPQQLDRLVEAVWAESALPADPRPAIHTCASRVRRALGDHTIVSTGGAYVLDVPALAIDAGRFDQLLDRATERSRTVVERIEMLSEALALWRGPALDGLSHLDWARADAARLDERRALADDLLAEALLEAGRADESIAGLDAAARRQPLRERTQLLLMSALHAAGRQAEALRVFQAYRRRLATDLGLEPSDALVELDRSIASGSTPPANGRLNGVPSSRGYRLIERIGEGEFALVYRGVQPAVGREVAIKVVREELANRPEFIRRFEAEAHLVARLEHPHIVPLYDFWREPYSAWLVMRLFRGGTLEDRISEGRMPVDDVVRLVRQIGGALDAAHRAGVVHRDVKPANVFLDDDGNAFLGDFGIAHVDGAVHTRHESAASPAHAVPGQSLREPAGPPADVHGLAVTAYLALTGRAPFVDAASETELLRRQLHEPLPSVRSACPDVSASLDEVLQRATAKLPAERYTTVGDFVGDVEAAAAGRPLPTGRGGSVGDFEARNPYKGLLAFQEADAADFFGRDALVERLIERVSRADASARFVVLVGPSGAGKSSVVRAGLLPALRAGHAPGSDTWFVTTMTPGTDPFDELESALSRVAGVSVDGLAELMRGELSGIGMAVEQVLPDETGELLVVLDQLEELFTQCPDPATRQRFTAGLVAAVSEPGSRLRVVTTLRADFYDRPLRMPGLASSVEQGTVVLTPLAADELEQAISGPALGVGVSLEPRLLTRIVADVVDRPGALPLLQYALTELFERRNAGVMTMAAYDELGGLAGALGRRAEAIHHALDRDDRERTRRVFSRLATPGDGTADTRRRVLRSELGADPAIDRIVDAFGRARLLAFDHDPATREPTVEVAHEALLREWPRLRGWLDDDRDGLRIHRHLTEAANGWEAAGRDSGELYRGARLDSASAWADTHAGELNDTESAFLEHSLVAHADAAAAELHGQRRLQRLLVAVACVAVLALITGGLAVAARRRAVANERDATAAAAEADAQRAEAGVQRDAAEAAARDAEAQRDAAERSLFDGETARMAALAPTLADNDLSLALLVAAEAHERSESPETLGALFDTLQGAGSVLRIVPRASTERGLPFAVAATANGEVVMAYQPNRIEVRDLGSLELLRTITVDDPQTYQQVTQWRAPGIGDGVAVWAGDEAAHVIDLVSGDERPLPGGAPSGVGLDLGTGRIVVVDDRGGVSLYDSAGSTAARWAVGGDGLQTIADAIDAGLVDPAATTVGPEVTLRSFVEFSPDGAHVWVARGWGVRQYATATGALTGEFPLQQQLSVQGQLLEAIDDTHVAVSSFSEVAELDVTTGRVTGLVGPDDLDERQALFQPVAIGDDIAVPSPGGTILVVPADGSRAPRTMAGRVGPGGAAALLPGGTLLLSGGAAFAEHTIDGGGLVRSALPGTDGATAVWASRDGIRMTALHEIRFAARVERAQEWSCDVGGRGCTITADRVAATDGAEVPITWWADPYADVQVRAANGELEILSSEGESLGVVDGAPTSWVFVPRHREWVATLEFPTFHLLVRSLPDAQVLADLQLDGINRIMTGSPDGRTLFFIDQFQTNVQVLDTRTWTMSPAASETLGEVIWAAFDQTGERLVTIAASGEVTLRDGATFAPVLELGGDGCCAAWTSFSDDGRLLLVRINRSVQLWDTETGRPIGQPITLGWDGASPVPGRTPVIADIADDRDSAGVVVHRYEVDTWADLACQAAGRNMTRAEWELYGPSDQPHHATCPQWPLPADDAVS